MFGSFPKIIETDLIRDGRRCSSYLFQLVSYESASRENTFESQPALLVCLRLFMTATLQTTSCGSRFNFRARDNVPFWDLFLFISFDAAVF